MTKLDELIICPATRALLDDFLAKPAHALMLTGERGAGLGTIAQALAHELANQNCIYLEPTLHKQQKTELINADDIADLMSIVRNRQGDNLAIVIDGADQTAPGVFERMLKLIEEPVAGVHYIFTAHNLSVIPDTILSRSNLIRVSLPSSDACHCLYSNLPDQVANQIRFIADRRPALIMKLCSNPELFASDADDIRLAKTFLSGNMSDRLESISKMTDRKEAQALCRALSKLVITLARKGALDPRSVAQRLDLISATATRLSANGNVRLQLVNLAVNFTSIDMV